MLYAILCYNQEDVVGAWSREKEDDVMQALLAVQKPLADAGRLGPVARLLPTTAATTLRKGGGEPLVIDGPFAETKEQLLGFYVVAWPKCVGPLERLPPELQTLWFSHIREARPSYMLDYKLALSLLAMPVAGFVGGVLGIWQARHEPERLRAWCGALAVSASAFGLRQSALHAASFRESPLMPAEEALFDDMAQKSLDEQAAIEAADKVSFDDFVAAYNSSTLCGNH